MNILIVDDEIQTVRAIKHSINWEKLKIDKVFTAHNISHAKEILSHDKIDIVICDIEMPQGSGLDLLQWMKDNCQDTESILLTCHAEFEFAKKAIELGSFNYLVKPIPFEELERTVFQAAAKIEANRRVKAYSEYGEYWIKNQAVIEESFWSDLITGQLTDKPATIAHHAAIRKVNYQSEEKYLLVLISKKRLVTKLNSWNSHLLDYALKNIAGEVFYGDVNANSVVILNGHLVAVIQQESEHHSARVKTMCKEYIISCNQYLGCSVSCYIGDFVFGEQLAEQYKKLLNLDRQNVALNSKIYDLNEWQYEVDLPFSDLQKRMMEWSIMLHRGEKKKLEEQMIAYPHRLAGEEKLNMEVLSIFQQDILQMVYAYLEQKDIQAHQLFKDPQSQELYRNSVSNVDQMSRWISFFISKAVDYMNEIAESQSVVNKVKAYIHANLKNDLSRDEIANQVFLNPDYLNRVFKKSTGMSLTEYIIDARIKKSQMLLSSTNLPVSSVAAEVGYDNLTYFSKLFKKVTGFSPSDYKKAHSKSENNKKSR